MKSPIRWIAIAVLGLFLSLGFHRLPLVHAQLPITNQTSAVNLLQLGKQRYDAGQFTAAVEILQQAVQHYKQTGDIQRQAQVLSFLSLADQNLGNWKAANQSITESLNLLKHPNSDKLIYAQVLNAQGHLQLAQGNAEAALATWKAAAGFYAQMSDVEGVIGSKVNQARAMQVLGLYRQAKKQLVDIEQTLLQQPNAAIKITGLHNLGNIRRQSGDLQQSQELLTQGLEIIRSQKAAVSPQLESQILLSLANTERAIAYRAANINNADDTQQYHQNALRHYQQAATIATSPVTRFQAQVNQLSLLAETQEIAAAEDLWMQINQSLHQLPATRPSIYAQVNLAKSLIELQTTTQKTVSKIPAPSAIAQLLENAIQQAESIDDARSKSYGLGTLGELWEHQKPLEAKNFTQQALQIAQFINAPDLAYQWQWQMGRLLQAKSEHQNHNQTAEKEAIAYYTQAVDILKQLRSDLVALHPYIQLSFRESVEPIYRQLVDLLLRAEKPTPENLSQARNVIEALQIAELDNFFQDACAQTAAINIDNLDPTAAIVYPIILPDRLEIILKLPGKNNLRHYANREISEAEIDKTVESLRNALRRPTASAGQVKQISQQLYNWLIQPFAAELEITQERDRSQIKNLVFVLDGSLRNIPPAVLYDGNRYLVERYAVAVTPGLQLFDSQHLRREALTVLLAGVSNAPSFEKEGLGPIDNVEIELTGIQQLVNRSKELANQLFLKENIEQQIQATPFNIVHIATHGQFSSNPEQTFILDWDKRIPIRDFDNMLRASNIKQANPIDMLILSACETATGDNRAALGLAGIAIRAGARSTLATLTQVNDASTAEFMIRFYQQLKNPQLTKADALRNTQMAFLKESTQTDYSRPYHWAPFILVGNWL